MCDLTLTAAVFADADNLILVRLEDDDAERATSDAAARGYSYAGSIAVVKGLPKIQIEGGFAPVMVRAGVVFAGMLGTRLKQFQEEN